LFYQSIDGKINEIRRKISALRAEMLDTEGSIRDRINRDLTARKRRLG
jgi:hypothetical protein